MGFMVSLRGRQSEAIFIGRQASRLCPDDGQEARPTGNEIASPAESGVAMTVFRHLELLCCMAADLQFSACGTIGKASHKFHS